MNLTPKQIIKVTAKYYDLLPEHLTAVGKKGEFVIPRYVAMYLIKQFCSRISLYKVGKIFHRDRTTVIYGCNRISNEIEIYQDMRDDVNSIETNLFKSLSEVDDEVDDYFGVFGWYDYFPLPEKYKKPEIDFSTPFKSPFADRESCVNRAYSGYKAVV